MKRKGFLCVVALALVCTTAIQTRASITIISESYHVRGNALHHRSPETISYNMRGSTPPLFGEINQPFDHTGFNDDGPHLLYTSSLATHYMEGGDMVFRVEQNPYGLEYTDPAYKPAEAHTAASLCMYFISGEHLTSLRPKIITQAGQYGQVSALWEDVFAGQSWSLVRNSTHTGTQWVGISIIPNHLYALRLDAWDIQWGTPSSVEVRFENIPIPLPGAVALAGIGTGLIVWFRRRNALGAHHR